MVAHRNLFGDDLHSPSNIQVANETGNTIPSLTVVKAAGSADVGIVSIAPVSSSIDKPLGVIKEDLPALSDGYAVGIGYMNGVDTSSWTVGTRLFSNASGGLTIIETGNYIGTVLISDATDGVIFVQVGTQGLPGLPGTVATQGIVLVTKTDIVSYGTISAALADSTNGDAVLLGSGIYNESFSVPIQRAVIALYSAITVFIFGSEPEGDRVTVGDLCYIRGLVSFIPYQGDGAAFNYVGTFIDSFFLECESVGGGLTTVPLPTKDGTGFRASGPDSGVGIGRLVGQLLLHRGDCTNVFEADNSGMLLYDAIVDVGDITNIVKIGNNGSIQTSGLEVATETVATNALNIAEGTYQTSGLTIRGAENAIYISGSGANISLDGTRIDGTVNDILVEPGVTDTVFEMSAGSLSFNKISAETAWFENANIAMAFLDASAEQRLFQIVDEISVGIPGAHGIASFGGGNSYTQSMKVLNNNNLTSGSFGDLTSTLNVTAGDVSIFPDVTTGNTVFFGSEYKFAGFDINTVGALSLGGGTLVWEYWNGSIWSTFNVMAAVKEHPHTQYANDVWGRTGVEVISFGNIDMDLWDTLDLDGFTKYWVRVRISSNITTSPTLKTVNLVPDKLRVSKDGTAQTFGEARVNIDYPWKRTILSGSNGEVAGSVDITVSTNITVDGLNNSFTNNSVTGRIGLFEVYDGIDTSVPIRVSLDWLADGTTGNVEWELFYVRYAPGDILDGTLTDTRTTIVSAVPAVAGTLVRTDFFIDIDDAVPRDVFAIKLLRDATGSNPDDTFSGTVTLVDTRLRATKWLL